MDSPQFARTACYLSQYHILICLGCGIGVRRNHIASHFRTQHRFTTAQYKALNVFCNSIIPDSDAPSTEAVPSHVENAIAELPLFSDGLLCQINRAECQYICRSSESMRKHCQRVHQWQRKSGRGRPSIAEQTNLTSRPWITVQCQRFFLFGPNSHYFEVRTTDQNADTLTSDTWQQMETTIQQAQKNLTDQVQDDAHDTSPWLRRTRWAEILTTLSRPQLLEYIQKPDLEEDSDEVHLWNAVPRLIEHCQRTVMKSGNFVRTQMNQLERVSTSRRPLQAYQHRSSLLKSCYLWQQILLFFVRSQSDESIRLPYKLSPIQQQSLQRLQDCLRTQRTEISSDDAEQPSELDILQQICLDFCFTLLHHRLRTDEYESPLVFALAVLGLTEHGFRGPDDYPSMLSGLIKTSQFMMTQLAVRPSLFIESFFHDLGTEAQPDQDTISRSEQIMHAFMVRGTQSPMQWMIDLRSYGLKIALNTTAEGRMSWIGDQIVFQDIQFTMPEFRAFVHGLLHETDRLLSDDLLFSRTISEAIPTVNLIQIKDNVINSTTGWNFLQDVRNSSLINGTDWIRQRIFHSSSLRTQLFPEIVNRELPPSPVLAYLTHVRTFLTKLLLLMHITGGQPARIPEILTVRHSNSSHDEPRNIFIEDGLVSFVTRYHKGYAISGEQKIIHRYLPYEISLIIVRYLWLVLPLVERFESFYCLSYKLSMFLWPPAPHQSLIGIWDSGIVRQALQEESRIGLGQTLNIASYRHLAIGISRRFLSPGHHFSDEENAEKDMQCTEEEAEQEILDQQAGHSSYVAGAIYARSLTERPNEIWSQRQRFRRISTQWHQFLGFTAVRIPSRNLSLKRPASTDLEMEDSHHYRLSQLRTISVDTQLRQLLGPAAIFRSIQRSALQAIVRGDSPVLTIMPTGGGKSLLFLLPASYEMSGTTIVVVPLISLRTDLVRRCQELSISCRVWNSRQPADGARIVFVTPESAVTSAFANFLNRLRTLQTLDRIVLDECHLVLDQTSFRTAFDQLCQFSRGEIPLVFLTATLPPCEETAFWQRLTLSRVPHHIFRTTTVRANIRYAVRSFSTMTDIMHCTKSMIRQSSVGRMIIYCLDVRTVEWMAKSLGILRYHSRYEKKAEALEQFMSNQCRTIVATSALGLGIDLADIRTVIHVEAPRNLLDYAQESGRAGRDGQISDAIILQSSAAVSRIGEQNALLHQYLTGYCRRRVLNSYLDGDEDFDSCTTSMRLCDLCTGRQTSAADEASPSSLDFSRTISEAVQSRQGRFVREEAQEEIKQQSIDLEKGMRLLRSFQDQCMLCHSMRSEQHCISACTASNRGSYEEAVQYLRGRIRYDKYSGCFRCGLPQSICASWDQREGGFRRKAEVECQFGNSLSEAGAVLLCEEEYFQGVQKRAGERLQIRWDERINVEVWRKKMIEQLGKKMRWLGVETNVLFREVIYYYLELKK